jgi:hypothetical protein
MSEAKRPRGKRGPRPDGRSALPIEMAGSSPAMTTFNNGLSIAGRKGGHGP